MNDMVQMPSAEENLGLVHLCANRFRGRGVDYDELYSAGCLGLVKAAKAFDPDRGVKFSTYAVPVIFGEIKRLFRDGGTIRVSRTLKELSRRLRKLCTDFEQQHGREPTVSELSQLTGESETEITQALCSSQPVVSLTAPDEKEGQLDVAVDPPDESIVDLLALRQVMVKLPESDRRLLVLRYFRNMTQTKTAKLLGMTQVQVSRREKKLLAEMRKELLD